IGAEAHIHKDQAYKRSRSLIFVGWDRFEEDQRQVWTNVEECEIARESCFKMKDCKDDSVCLDELVREHTAVEGEQGLVEDEADHSHDLHPCTQIVHYCYGMDTHIFQRVINQRVYWQYAFEHNFNHA
ncbi:hypothetical protein PFISCL1PPCAC_15983, partial [Pristionchus fissidentatus]